MQNIISNRRIALIKNIINDKQNLSYTIIQKRKGITMIQKNEIISKLKELKPLYSKEGFIIKGLFGSYSRDEATENSDIDILVESTPDFAAKYGFKAISRVNEIKEEISNFFGIPVDLADSSGMGKTAKKFIIDKAIYV